jgi:hypothetical protein
MTAGSGYRSNAVLHQPYFEARLDEMGAGGVTRSRSTRAPIRAHCRYCYTGHRIEFSDNRVDITTSM